MNEALHFFHAPEAQRILRRAAKAAGVPLSIHYVSGKQEGNAVAHFGACAICQQVNAEEPGRHACRASRLQAASLALGQAIPAPFICHMGFACLSVTALPGEQYVITLGPFAPAQASQSLAHDLQAAWDALEMDASLNLDSLDEVHRSPGGAVPAVAEWLVEALESLWKADQAAADEENLAPPEESLEVPLSTPRKAKPSPTPTPVQDFSALEASIALAAAKQDQVRKMVRDYIAQVPGKTRRKLGLQRSSTIACVATIGEAADRAKLPTALFWKRFPAFSASVWEAQEEARLLELAMDLLGVIKRQSVSKRKLSPHSGRGVKQAFPALTAILTEHMQEGITLNKAAELLQEKPSTISHRLERSFELSFTEYLGLLRVQEAKRLLRRSSLSLAEIGARVGVRDQSNFSKVFKKHLGMSPKAYRKQLEEKK